MLKKLASTMLMFGIGASLFASSGCYVRTTTRGSGYHHRHAHHRPPPPPPRRSTTTIVVRP